MSALSNVLIDEHALHGPYVEICSGVHRVAVPDFLSILVKGRPTVLHDELSLWEHGQVSIRGGRKLVALTARRHIFTVRKCILFHVLAFQFLRFRKTLFMGLDRCVQLHPAKPLQPPDHGL